MNPGDTIPYRCLVLRISGLHRGINGISLVILFVLWISILRLWIHQSPSSSLLPLLLPGAVFLSRAIAISSSSCFFPVYLLAYSLIQGLFVFASLFSQGRWDGNFQATLWLFAKIDSYCAQQRLIAQGMAYEQWSRLISNGAREPLVPTL